MKINLNSPDGNIFVVLCKLYDELRPYYPCEAIEEWLQSVMDNHKNYDEIISTLEKEWKAKFETTAGKLQFYKSKKYEIRKGNGLCIY